MRLFALFCVTLAVVLATVASAKKAKTATHEDLIKQVYHSARSAKKVTAKATAIQADPKAAAAHSKNLRRSSKQAKFTAVSNMVDTFADISTLGAQPAKTRTSYARSGMLTTAIFADGDVDCSGDPTLITAVAGNECIPGNHNDSLPNEKAVSHLFMMRKNRDAVSYTDVTFSHSDRDCVAVDSASTEELSASIMGMCAPTSLDPNGQHVQTGLTDRHDIFTFSPSTAGVRMSSFQSSKGCKEGVEKELVEYHFYSGASCYTNFDDTESYRYTCNENNEPTMLMYSDATCGTEVNSQVVSNPVQGCSREGGFSRIECIGGVALGRL